MERGWGSGDLNDPNMPPEIREIIERMMQPKDNTPLPPLKVPKPLPVGSPKLYQMKVTLLDIEPPIWRRFVAPSFMSLGHLHTLLQSVMGWGNAHACAFTINDNRFTLQRGGFSVDSMWDTEPSYDAEDYELCQLIKPSMTFHYEYDFGDGWEHEIVVENDTVSQNTKHCFYCIEGERACPPEDCGGVHGYEELLRILADPNDPEHDDKIEWLEFLGYRKGKFDSEKYDLAASNRELGVRSPANLSEQSGKNAALDKKKKEDRKRKEAAKKRNRK
jgi:hypothetical protein